MQVKKKTPDIRFKSFSEDWKENEFGRMANKIIGGGTPSTSVDEYWNGNIPWIQSSDVLEDVLYIPASKKCITKKGLLGSAASLVPKNSIAIVTRVGVGKVAYMPYEYTTSQDFMSLSDLKADLRFLAYCLYKNLQQEKNSAQGTSIKGITKEYLLSLKALLPTDENEQIKIGEFFKTLDNLIAQKQQKLERTLNLKQAMLQRMFPQKGETVPRVRFAGFTGDWEEKAIGEIFSERNERSSVGELISVTQNSGVVLASDLERHDNSSNDKSNYKVVKVGDIAYNSMRMWQGASGYSNYNGILSPAYTVITPLEGINSMFFSYQFKRYSLIQEFKKYSQGLTSDTWNLKYPSLSIIKVLVPQYDEQTRISEYFVQLDMLIQAYSQQLVKLKNIKSACLKKMFV